MAGNTTSDAIDFKPLDTSLPERHDKVKPGDKLHKKSRFDEPIRRDDGTAHGKSRNVGDVDPQTRHAVIGLLIDEAVRRGHSLRDIAYLLLIARLESGFNPDAASARSSASGVMQITDITADDIAQVTAKPAWVRANPRDTQVDVSNSASRFNARKNIVAGIIQFERAKAKSLAWGQNYDATRVEARLYQYYHYGLYLPDAREDRVGLNEYSTHIAPMIDRVESALKTQARFQVQLKQPDGKGYANALFAAIVPKKDTSAGIPATASEQHGVPRLFADLWAQLQARWNRGSAPRTPAIYDYSQFAALKKASAIPGSAAPQATPPAAGGPPPKTSTAETSKPAENTTKAQDSSTESACVTYPLRVQDVLEADVIFGRTDDQGFTPIFTLGSVGEVQFFVLNDDYLNKAQDTSKAQGGFNSSSPDAYSTSEKAANAAISPSPPEAASKPGEPDADQQQSLSKEESAPEAQHPTVENASSDTSSQTMETPVGGLIAFGALGLLYAPRLPSLERASQAFQKQGHPFDSSLFEYSRSFVCKPTKVFEQITPETKADASKVQIAEVTASITSKQAKPSSSPIAQVTTSKTNAQAPATGVPATPWMTIALKERTRGVMQIQGSVRSSAKGRKLFDEIKAASEEFRDCQKKISAENHKSPRQRNQALIGQLKQKVADAKRTIDEGMGQVIKLESDETINNPRIVEYISATRAAVGTHAQHQAVDDEINWCASFVSWCMQKSGYKPVDTGSDARAIDWATYGREAKENEAGAVVVLQMLRASQSGVRTGSGNHIGFLIEEGLASKSENGKIVTVKYLKLLGGNQRYDIEDKASKGGKSAFPRVSVTKLVIGVDANIIARRLPTLEEKS
jgi:uncharacterized protein (TIGR02594 family)